MGDRERRKKLFQSYYGINKTQPQHNPLDLDSNEFDSAQWFKKTLSEKELQELVKEDNKVTAEIRALDGDMKTLVYENYSKFISATETIKKMKENVENMEGEMEKLKKNMEKITNVSAHINTSLVEKRDKINQLSGVHGLLKRLQFVFELPSKLRKCLEMQSYAQAYRYYTKTTDILKHYSHLPSFTNIQAESDLIMKELVVKLKKKLTNENTKSNELSECVEILLGLKEPPEKLWKDYLQFQLRELKKSLKNAEKECDRLEPEVKKKPQAVAPKQQKAPKKQTDVDFESDDESVVSDQTSFSSKAGTEITEITEVSEMEEPEETELIVDPSRKVAVINEHFLREFTEFVCSFTNLFIQTNRNDQNVLSEDNLRKAERDLLQITDEIAQLYFTSIETKCLKIDEDPKLVPSAFSFVASLNKMYKDIITVDALTPQARLNGRNRSMISNFLLNYTNYIFSIVEGNVKEQLKKILSQNQQKPEVLAPFAKTFTGEFLESAKKTISNLEVFIRTETKFMQEHSYIFTQDVIKKASSFWGSLLKLIMDFLRPVTGNTSHDPIPLILTKILLEFETSIANAFFIYIADTFSPGNRKALLPDAKNAIQQSKEAAQKMLRNYVDICGQKLSILIRTSLETKNWMGKKEPRKVSLLWEQISEDFTNIYKFCQYLFPDDEKQKPPGSDSGSRTGSRAGRVNPFGEQFMNNIDKLFSDHIQIFTSVEFKSSSIVMAIVKITIKTFIECIRLCTFSKAGYQQIQVDVEYIRIHFWRFVDNENVLNRLLEEVMNSTVNRCVEPVPMDQSVVQKLATETGQQQQQS